MSFADLDFPVSAPDNLSSSVSCCRLLSAEYLVPLLACTPPSRKMWTSLSAYLKAWGGCLCVVFELLIWQRLLLKETHSNC